MHQGGHTNEDEGQSDAKGQDVATQRLVVLAVTFGKDAQARVDVVFTKSLRRHSWFLKKRYFTPSMTSSSFMIFSFSVQLLFVT